MANVPDTISVGSSAEPVVSVIVPARNEEACLGTCLESLLAQSGGKVISKVDADRLPLLVSGEGVQYEIIVVDDSSTDRTRAIAAAFDLVRTISADPPAAGWTGKANACLTGARAARGRWLLFTDADTFHKPGSLARSLAEAQKHGADLLSYSPEQEVRSFAEKALMPLVFAELARTYKPKRICDPACPDAAANGQFLLIHRDAYDAVGGHAAVAGDLLEDVALARLVKRSGRRLRFRYGGDAVRTRMYRSFGQLLEGWTKNLVLLFPSAGRLAVLRGMEFAAMAGGITALAAGLALRSVPVALAGAAIAVPT